MKKVIIAIVIIIALAVAYYLARPLFVDDIVDEAFPEIKQVTLEEQDQMLEMPEEAMLAEMSEEEKMAAEMMLLEKSAMVEVIVEEDMEPMPEEAEEVFPQIITQGNFRDADDFHKGSGQAKLIQLNQDEHLLRLENLSVTNGPDLFVYLTKHENPSSSSDVQKGFVNLGRLKGNKGNQNYSIPEDVDITEFNSVVIYCKAFSVLFSPAPLS